jgi:DNA-binding NarL/FixJ family response regulator
MRHRANKFAGPTLPCSNSTGLALSVTIADGMEGSSRPPQVQSAPPTQPNSATDHPIVVIEKRLLLGECLSRAIKAFGRNVISFPDVESWLEVASCTRASLVMLCVGSKAGSPETHQAVSLLLRAAVRYPTVVLSDAENPGQIVAALQQGVRGYISTNMPLQVAMEALHLVQAGGLFVPASSLVAATKSTDHGGLERSPHGFTSRQAAVVEALRRGKANKIIAYELNMRESTVKVHVRNIMKKLKAKNRTEVAFLTNAWAHPE